MTFSEDDLDIILTALLDAYLHNQRMVMRCTLEEKSEAQRNTLIHLKRTADEQIKMAHRLMDRL